MKVPKMMSLSEENVKRLREYKLNSSKIVDDLLNQYFKAQEPKSLAERKKRLAELEAEERYEEELKKIKEANYE